MGTLLATFGLSNKAQEKEALKAKVTLALFEQLKEGNLPFSARDEMTALISHSGEQEDVHGFLMGVVDEITEKIGHEAGRLTAEYIANTGHMFAYMPSRTFRQGLVTLSYKGAHRWLKALNDESEHTGRGNEDLAKIAIGTLGNTESHYLKNMARNVIMQCVVPREGRAVQISHYEQSVFSLPSPACG